MSNVDRCREFELLHSQLRDLSKSFPEFQLKTVTALLVIVGWLITSVSARDFIERNSAVALPATLFALGVLVLFKVIWVIGHYRLVVKLHARLRRLAPEVGVAADGVDAFRLSPVLPVTYVVVNLLLSAAIGVIVWLTCNPVP